MTYRVCIDEREIEAEIVARRPHLSVRLGETRHAVVAAELGEGEFAITVDGVPHRGWYCTIGRDAYVRLAGRTYLVQLPGRVTESAAALPQEEVRASMPGVVVAVHCEPGASLKAGDKVLTLESMKLQLTLVASHDAVVERVHVAAAGVFERGALLVSFVRPESGEL